MNSAEPRHCAVIPCLNAAQTVEAVVAGALRHVGLVLVVDDGSTDDSGAAAETAGGVVVRHGVNRGKGAALSTGLREARARGYSHMLAIDADAQHDPEDMPALLAASRADPRALVVGCRGFDVPNVPRASRFGRWFSNLWVRIETGRALSDTQSGYRVYPVESALALALGESRFEWEVEVITRSLWGGVPVLEVPVRVTYKPKGEHTSHYRGLVDSARISLLHTRLVIRLLLRPLFPVRRISGPK